MFEWLLGAKETVAKRFISMHTSTPGKEPTVEDLPYKYMVAFNRADNIVFMNIEGEIVRYIPETLTCKTLRKLDLCPVIKLKPILKKDKK